MGFTNYYHKFLVDFAKRTAGLNAVKSKKSIEWTEELVNDFNVVKEMFAQAPCPASPDFSVMHRQKQGNQG